MPVKLNYSTVIRFMARMLIQNGSAKNIQNGGATKSKHGSATNSKWRCQHLQTVVLPIKKNGGNPAKKYLHSNTLRESGRNEDFWASVRGCVHTWAKFRTTSQTLPDPKNILIESILYSDLAWITRNVGPASTNIQPSGFYNVFLDLSINKSFLYSKM